MIDASRSNDPAGGWGCRALMGHRVSPREAVEETKESCFFNDSQRYRAALY